MRRIAAAAGMFLLAPTLLVVAEDCAYAGGNVRAGREKARQCEACHRLDGRSAVPEAPNLAGQTEQYLVAQLRAFQRGDRNNEMMSLVVLTLSSQDIEDLAAYYAAIEVKVGKIPGD